MLYTQLLLQSFLSALLVPLASPSGFFAMKAFGGYNLAVPALISVGGAFAAQIVNFAIGRFLLRLLRQKKIHLPPGAYPRGERYARAWLLPLLLLTWIPFGPLLTLLAGFFGVPARRAFPALLIGWAGYYLYWVFT